MKTRALLLSWLAIPLALCIPARVEVVAEDREPDPPPPYVEVPTARDAWLESLRYNQDESAEVQSQGHRRPRVGSQGHVQATTFGRGGAVLVRRG